MIQTRQIGVERISLTSSRSFEEVVAGLEQEIGHPDIAAFSKRIAEARSLAELETAVQEAIGPSGLMEFARFDIGAVLPERTGCQSAEKPASSRRQSAHHERNGEARSRCGFVCTGHDPD
jgi:hypothetical protein